MAVIAVIGPAQAHVKWFAHYDVAQIPLRPDWITSVDFIYLVCAALAAITVSVLIENSLIGRLTTLALNRTTLGIRLHAETLMRATYGAFFIALWAVGGIILTPELATGHAVVSWLQLGIAICFVWRPTLVVAGLGIVGLYAYGLSQYGLFHLMDYPIFLGAAAYFAMTGIGWKSARVSQLDVMRCATAVTLMWASVEKWAYPDWTYPLFIAHPLLAMGYTPSFYMQSAGVVEFSLALALLGPPLVRRASAIVLTATFFTAVLVFGKIDAIGHAPIMVVLVVIAADNATGRRWSPTIVPICYLATLAVTIAAYYLGHFLLFPKA